MANKLKHVLPEIREYMNEAMNTTTVDVLQRLQRNLELHPSGFPYCGLSHLWSHLQQGPSPLVQESFAGSYFTSVGTLVHTLIQRFAGKGGRVWGHWKCSHQESGLCSYVNEELALYHDCPVCGHYCEYEEIGYNIDGILVGHQDCLYEDTDGDFWVLDYKTCLLMKAQKHAKDGKALADNNTYRAQQKAYVTLAHKVYGKSHGIKPKGWILMFMPRDIPFQFQFYGQEMSAQDKSDTWDRIVHDMDAFTTIMDATEYADIAHLVKTKPCQSLSDYNNNMRNPYSECGLLPVCFGKQLVPTLKNEMDGNVMLPIREHYQRVIAEQKVVVADIKKAQKKKTVKVNRKGGLDG